MRHDVVEREAVPVVYAAAKGGWDDVPGAAGRAFARLEAAMPPRGRKMYGYRHPPALEYRACYARREGDDAAAHGLDETTLPGGRYARVRLRCDDAFERIGPAFESLAKSVEVDGERPWLEVYRRHDEVDLLVPVEATR